MKMKMKKGRGISERLGWLAGWLGVFLFNQALQRHRQAGMSLLIRWIKGMSHVPLPLTLDWLGIGTQYV